MEPDDRRLEETNEAEEMGTGQSRETAAPEETNANYRASAENDNVPGYEDIRTDAEEGCQSEEPGVSQSEEPGINQSEEPGVSQSEEPGVSQSEKPAQKKAKLKLSWKTVTLAAVVAAVVLFAIIWEAASGGDPVIIGGGRSKRTDIEESEFAARSEIQRELDGLDWVWQEFLTINEFSRPGDLLEETNGIVIHYIGNPNTTALQNRNYFENLSVTEERYAEAQKIKDEINKLTK